MKILLTGSSGYLGSAVLTALEIIKDARITIINRKYNPTFKNVQQIIGDLRKKDTYQKIKKIKFDTIIHCSGYVPKNKNQDLKYKCREGNLETTVKLLSSTRCKNFILVSACEVYGDQNRNKPISEDFTPNPISNYAKSKLESENYCKKFFTDNKVNLCILRFSTIIGENDQIDRAIPNFITSACKSQDLEVYGDGKQKRDYLYISDAVHAIILTINKIFRGIYNVSSGHGISILTAAKTIIRLTGSPSKIKFIESKSKNKNGYIFDNTKFQKHSGFKIQFPFSRAVCEIIKSKRCIIFDLDGTLINVDEKLFRLHSYVAGKFNYKPLNRDIYLRFKYNGISERDIVSKIGMGKKDFSYYQSERIEMIESDKFLKFDILKPHVQQILRSLNRSYTLILLSKRRSIIKTNLELKKFKIRRLFSKIIIDSKSKISPLRNLLHSHSFIATIFVGDTEDDSEVAKIASLPVILVADGVRDKNFLSKLYHSGVISKIEHIESLLNNFDK